MLPTNPLLNATAPAGPHLPTATLRQYAAGTLAPAAQHRVEAHTLACPRCADILAGLLQTTPATTDQALVQLQLRLRRRVQQAPQALPATRAHRRHRLMALQLAAAATLLFGLVAGGWWTWQQRHASPATGAQVAATAAPATPAPEAAACAQVAVPAAPAAGRPTPPRRPITSLADASHRKARPLRRPGPLVAAVPAAPASAAPASAAPASAEVVARAAVAAPPAAPVATPVPGVVGRSFASSPAKSDSAAAGGRLGEVVVVAKAKRQAEPAALVRNEAMPAAPAIPPAPVGGYGTWREKLRREAAEFKPEQPEQPLSGAVQLRLLIGADGKIQEIKVLHGLRADYDAEAQRLVCDGTGWVPGIGGGKRAAQPVDVAVPFQ